MYRPSLFAPPTLSLAPAEAESDLQRLGTLFLAAEARRHALADLLNDSDGSRRAAFERASDRMNALAEALTRGMERAGVSTVAVGDRLVISMFAAAADDENVHALSFPLFSVAVPASCIRPAAVGRPSE